MTTLDQTLLTLSALLEDEPPIAIGEADEAIWTYLSSVEGLSAQVKAFEVLRAKVIALNSTSASMPRLLDDLDRHMERLKKRPV